jgi:hypothetical protein
MTRVCVDKQTRTTAAIKKYVDKGYLSWFETTVRGDRAVEIGRNRDKTGPDTHENRLPDFHVPVRIGYPLGGPLG